MKCEDCGDAVSRDAVLIFIEKVKESGIVNYGSLLDIATEVRNLPSVNPQEPKTGHWVEENINEWSRKVFCSKCGCPSPFEHISNGDVYSASGYGVSNKTKYCPNCGAKMESEDFEDKTQPKKSSWWWECERCGKLIPYMADFCDKCADELLGEPPKPFEPQVESEDKDAVSC